MVELKLVTDYPRELIAVDEVGRSPLSGPVVIGAVRVLARNPGELATLLRSLRRQGVRDSKALTGEQRALVLKKLGLKVLPFREKGTFLWKGMEVSFITWEMCHETIDRENIFEASMRGMKEAALFLSQGDRSKTTVLIDGHMRLRWPEEPCPWTEHAIVQGDTKSPLIGLASVIAKESRDAWMRRMHERWPEYGFLTNVGYPTKQHRDAIEVHGPCPIHRRSFSKVKEFIRD